MSSNPNETEEAFIARFFSTNEQAIFDQIKWDIKNRNKFRQNDEHTEIEIDWIIRGDSTESPDIESFKQYADLFKDALQKIKEEMKSKEEATQATKEKAEREQLAILLKKYGPGIDPNRP
jgi:maltose-binding protein MalE